MQPLIGLLGGVGLLDPASNVQVAQSSEHAPVTSEVVGSILHFRLVTFMRVYSHSGLQMLTG